MSVQVIKLVWRVKGLPPGPKAVAYLSWLTMRSVGHLLAVHGHVGR